MCGVVGAILNNPSESDLEILKNTLLETEIRGKHASGIAWYNGNELKCINQPIPISELLKTFDMNSLIYENKVRMIGHIRYSTSDLQYNQPIGDSNSYIVHNGVISQSSPSEWESKYGYDCSTKNDTELLWNCFKTGENYNYKFPGCSASYIFINSNGEIKNGRNSLRPQWIGYIKSGKIIASTKNILIRAGITDIEIVPSDDNLELIERNMDATYTRI